MALDLTSEDTGRFSHLLKSVQPVATSRSANPGFSTIVDTAVAPAAPASSAPSGATAKFDIYDPNATPTGPGWVWNPGDSGFETGLYQPGFWSQDLRQVYPNNSAFAINHNLRIFEDTPRDQYTPEMVNYLQQVSSVAPQYDKQGKLANGDAMWNDFVTRIEDRESGGGTLGIKEIGTPDDWGPLPVLAAAVGGAYFAPADAAAAGGTAAAEGAGAAAGAGGMTLSPETAAALSAGGVEGTIGTAAEQAAGLDALTAGGAAGTGVAGKTLMPAAVPEADPTFGGLLEQTAPGVFEQPALGPMTATPQVASEPLSDVAPTGPSAPSMPPAVIDPVAVMPGGLPPDPASGPTGGGVGAVSPGGAMDMSGALAYPAYTNETQTIFDVPDVAAGGGLMSDIGDFIARNKAWVAPLSVSSAGLVASLANKPKVPEIGNLENLANQAANGPAAQAAQSAAASLIPSVATGNLPPGADSLVNQAVHDAKIAIRAKYAQLGMSGSTPETQELNAADARGEAMRFQFADELTKTGLAAAGVSLSANSSSAQIYSLIMQQQLAQDQALQNAIANFASAASIGMGLGLRGG